MIILIYIRSLITFLKSYLILSKTSKLIKHNLSILRLRIIFNIKIVLGRTRKTLLTLIGFNLLFIILNRRTKSIVIKLKIILSLHVNMNLNWTQISRITNELLSSLRISFCLKHWCKLFHSVDLQFRYAYIVICNLIYDDGLLLKFRLWIDLVELLKCVIGYEVDILLGWETFVWLFHAVWVVC